MIVLSENKTKQNREGSISRRLRTRDSTSEGLGESSAGQQVTLKYMSVLEAGTVHSLLLFSASYCPGGSGPPAVNCGQKWLRALRRISLLYQDGESGGQSHITATTENPGICK